MNVTTCKNKIGIFLVGTVTVCVFAGCQKEITGSVDTFGCKVQQWANLNASGGVSSQFLYSYDTATTKPTQLAYIDSIGAQTTVAPVFKSDTVFFASGSYAVLDGSNRITHLVEKNAIAALSKNGDYYYQYDPTGHLVKRTYDDGAAAYVSNLVFSGDKLLNFNTPSGAVTDAFSLAYTYSDTVTVKDFNYFMLARNFPELQLYLPCFNLGIFTTKAIVRTDFSVVIAVSPLPAYSSVFSNYSLTSQGYISSVGIQTTVVGSPAVNSGIGANYLCK